MAAPKTHYATRMERDHFDPELLDLYWRMIAERQLMYVRRVHLDMPRPWTNDPVLNSEFITNMYRELDPGTAYLINDILGLKSKDDRVFNVLMYRLMGSQSRTHAAIAAAHGGSVTVKNFALAKFMAAVEPIEKGSVFGDAYRVAGYEQYGGGSKAENIAIMFTELQQNMSTVMEAIAAATTAREGYDAILAIPGFGEFLSHQVMVDLLYKNASGEAILPFGEDQWVVAGPGARNGIWALLKPGIKPRSMMIVMEWLRDQQQEEFAKLEKPFPYLANDDGSPKLLSLCNIQSTLCEFFKYVRLWDGSTRAVRPYRPSAGSDLVRLPLFEGYPMDVAEAMLPLTPPPPVGGRRLPEAAEEPAPEIDAVKPVSEPLRAVNEDLQQPASTVLEAISPDGRPVQITINIYLAAPVPNDEVR
jgi:hypothetical protein